MSRLRGWRASPFAHGSARALSAERRVRGSIRKDPRAKWPGRLPTHVARSLAVLGALCRRRGRERGLLLRPRAREGHALWMGHLNGRGRRKHWLRSSGDCNAGSDRGSIFGRTRWLRHTVGGDGRNTSSGRREALALETWRTACLARKTAYQRQENLVRLVDWQRCVCAAHELLHCPPRRRCPKARDLRRVATNPVQLALQLANQRYGVDGGTIRTAWLTNGFSRAGRDDKSTRRFRFGRLSRRALLS
jgi:hypothetical protein